MRQDRTVAQRPLPRAEPVQSRRDEAEVMADLLSHRYDASGTENGEELLFSRPGIQRRVLQRLRRGEFAVVAEFDLHGMRVAEAGAALNRFLKNVPRQGSHCVRIVHGKGLRSPGGHAVLRGWVDRWLRRHRDVLAFCSARPVDGGTGAVYVLLKRR